jgi:ketosteroid isomerase-like protein
MDKVRLVHDTWLALSQGDLGPLEAALAPDAKWRAVEDGPWNCQSRAAILDVMAGNLANGLSGNIVEVSEAGDRLLVGFRPDQHGPDAWPLDDGVRYLVLTTTGESITEMKGCIDRAAAVAYAASG